MLVQNKGNNPFEANGLTLHIGTNDVDKTKFETFLKHPLMAKLAEKGVFVYEFEGKKQPTVAEMEALIADTFELELLETIKADDDRKGVQTAVNKRIAELTEAKK